MRNNLKSKQIKRQCNICGKWIQIKVFSDGAYNTGYYFGKIPLYTKEEEEKSLKAGTHKEKIAGGIFDILNRDPKPYDYAEYWECDKCYNK